MAGLCESQKGERRVLAARVEDHQTLEVQLGLSRVHREPSPEPKGELEISLRGVVAGAIPPVQQLDSCLLGPTHSRELLDASERGRLRREGSRTEQCE